MKKSAIISIVILSIIITFWTGYRLLHKQNIHHSKKTAISCDINQQDYVDRKKELMLKEYDSAFAVIQRETTVIYNLRGWSVTLLALWISVFLSKKGSSQKFMYWSGLFIMILFYLLEVFERNVMLTLVRKLRSLEDIFNIPSKTEFNIAVENYEFRDIEDENQSLISKDVLQVIGDPKVYCWSMFLYILYFIAIRKSLKKV